MKLFMIRHGQSEYNLRGVYTGQAEAMLTDEGKRQAAALRAILEDFSFDRVYSSDLNRAIHTQQLALPGIAGIPTPLLREIDVGSLAGQSIRKTREEHGLLNGHFAQFGGENPEAVQARVRQFLLLLEKDPCEYAAAFTHGGLIRAMLSHVLGTSIHAASLSNANCGIAVFEFNGKQWTLHAWNYGCKL